ncbi:transmembrane protein [Cavenderia fasciculata]|uniref:Transmembrane protein n=1 Tax=Cavenderia fasciculata TaxID=261658 RepID=F4Q8K2_CACFS|nr:uncharacterized protein DFA_09774 [Cavenderia fasciculata]EGG16102.1 transmembrane protein [Cavenderia fasciculata]|eukprot:XP_004352427.1 transmembrane protein [Cavenderia fasciculata]
MDTSTSKSEKELIDLKKELEELEKSQNGVKEKGLKFKEQIAVGFKSLDEICNTLDKQEKESSKLLQRITLLQSGGGDKSNDAVVEMKQKIQSIKTSIKQSKKTFTPETGGVFVRLFLGQVNVKHYREGERFRLKTEYEKFKFKTNPQFILFVALLFMFPSNSFITTSWQIWLLYYYVTLALRENILLVNGSSIRPWWIMHHYLSIAGALTNLLWPLSTSFTDLLPMMTMFSGAQGIVQILTNRYQQGQLYRMVAIGKANIMDVTSENMISDPGWTPSALFLLPFLLFVHCFQMYNGFVFLTYSYFKYHTYYIEWQVIACGLILVSLGIGNLVTTSNIYLNKWKSYSSSDNNNNNNNNITNNNNNNRVSSSSVAKKEQ